jgi:hypothetical protein
MKKIIWTASEMGRKGGRISRRTLTHEQAAAMGRAGAMARWGKGAIDKSEQPVRKTSILSITH